MICSKRSIMISGFSLLEVLISVLILSVGLTGLIRVFSMGLEAETRMKAYQDFAVLADSKMSELIAGRYIGLEQQEGVFGDPYAEYAYRIETEPAGQSQDGPLRRVVLRIFLPARISGPAFEVQTFLFALPEESRRQF